MAETLTRDPDAECIGKNGDGEKFEVDCDELVDQAETMISLEEKEEWKHYQNMSKVAKKKVENKMTWGALIEFSMFLQKLVMG